MTNRNTYIFMSDGRGGKIEIASVHIRTGYTVALFSNSDNPHARQDEFECASMKSAARLYTALKEALIAMCDHSSEFWWEEI